MIDFIISIAWVANCGLWFLIGWDCRQQSQATVTPTSTSAFLAALDSHVDAREVPK